MCTDCHDSGGVLLFLLSDGEPLDTTLGILSLKPAGVGYLRGAASSIRESTELRPWVSSVEENLARLSSE